MGLYFFCEARRSCWCYFQPAVPVTVLNGRGDSNLLQTSRQLYMTGLVIKPIPGDARRSTDGVIMLGQRCIWWTIIITPLVQRIVFAGHVHYGNIATRSPTSVLCPTLIE